MPTILFFLTMIITQPSSYTFQQKALTLEDGKRMKFSVANPGKEKDDVLLLVLHWGWDRSQPVPEYYGESFVKDLVMKPLEATEYRPVVLAPDCPYDKWHCEESEKALLELIDKSEKKYKISTGQLIVLGYSAGGIGAWYFCSRNPERVLTCIPMASLPSEKWIENWEIEDTYIIQAELDDLFPLDKMRLIEKKLQKQLDIPAIKVVEGAGHYETGKFRFTLQELFRRLCPYKSNI